MNIVFHTTSKKIEILREQRTSGEKQPFKKSPSFIFYPYTNVYKCTIYKVSPKIVNSEIVGKNWFKNPRHV